MAEKAYDGPQAKGTTRNKAFANDEQAKGFSGGGIPTKANHAELEGLAKEPTPGQAASGGPTEDLG